MNDEEEIQREAERRLVDVEKPPSLLVAAAVLAEQVMSGLDASNPGLAWRVSQDQKAATGSWRLVIIARAPAEWSLHWIPAKGESFRVADNDGGVDATEAFRGAQDFLQTSLGALSGAERAFITKCMFDGEAYFRISCEWGALWRIAVHVVVRGLTKKAGGDVVHICTLQEAPPERQQLH